MMDAINAMKNPSITNDDPMNFAPSNNVIVLMIKIKNPKVTTVIGNVNRINNGLTKIFNIDKMTLASKAV